MFLCTVCFLGRGGGGSLYTERRERDLRQKTRTARGARPGSDTRNKMSASGFHVRGSSLLVGPMPQVGTVENEVLDSPPMQEHSSIHNICSLSSTPKQRRKLSTAIRFVAVAVQSTFCGVGIMMRFPLRKQSSWSRIRQRGSCGPYGAYRLD